MASGNDGDGKPVSGSTSSRNIQGRVPPLSRDYAAQILADTHGGRETALEKCAASLVQTAPNYDESAKDYPNLKVIINAITITAGQFLKGEISALKASTRFDDYIEKLEEYSQELDIETQKNVDNAVITMRRFRDISNLAPTNRPSKSSGHVLK